MKTAVLQKTNCLSDSPDNTDASLLEELTLKLIAFQVSNRNHFTSENNKKHYGVIKSNPYNYSLNIDNFKICLKKFLLKSNAIKILPLISFLHSLRCYFKNKINIYFCDDCLTYFKKVILLETFLVCSTCLKRISSNQLQVLETFSSFYAIAYPLEPKAYIMGCLCNGPVLKNRPYIQCNCIYSHNHVDHSNILKNIVKCEAKVWKKVFSVCSLKYCLGENVFDTVKKLEYCINIKLLPFRNVILNPELIALQIEFYDSCHSLYSFFINKSLPNSEQIVITHMKQIVHACRSKKLIFTNFRYQFQDFALFYQYEFSNSSDNKHKFKATNRKSASFCSNLLLLFGFYLYFLKVLKFGNKRSLTTSKLLLLVVDRWQKRRIQKVLFKICGICNQQCNNTKTISASINYLQDVTNTDKIQNEHKVWHNEQAYGFVKNNYDNYCIEDNMENMCIKDENIDIYKSSEVDTNCSQLETLCSSDYLEKTLSPFQESNSNTTFQVNSVTTGKEELDIIDGVNIYSFETEPDLIEFSALHNTHAAVQETNTLEKSDIANSGRIVPTKTHDITKIKGWRNKLFSINNRKCLKSADEAKSIEIDTSKMVNSKIKLEPEEESLQIKEEPLEYIVEDDNQQIDVKVKEEPLSHDNLNLRGTNGVQELINNLNTFLLSEIEDYQNFKKQCNIREEQPGIFQSSILDEFLEKRSKLNISFKISEPYSTVASQDSVIPIVPPPKKDEQLEEKIKQLCSRDFLKNIQGDITKRKFIWVHGRPIMLEHETKKTNSSSKKRSFDNSDEVRPSPEKVDNNLKRVKITKKLEYTENSKDHDSDEPEEIKSKKPYLSLLNTFKSDEKDIEEKNDIHSKSLSKQKFPLIFPCSSVSNCHTQCAKFTKVQLVMVVNIGYKRPFLREVMNNLEKLRKDVTTIDSMWAHIAASAVCSNNDKRTVKRCLVPVVSDSLIEVVKFNIENVSTNISKINELNVSSVYKSICASNTIREDVTDIVQHEIKDVVEDMIEYVVKKEEYDLLSIPYDPDVPNMKPSVKLPVKRARKSKVERELKRLINVTLVDDWNDTNEYTTGKYSCGNEHCLKGCICNSLNGRFRVIHCGKLECMFECSCETKTNYSLNNFIQNGRNGTLAKDESSWHQTVICKNNEIIEVKAGAGKSKREKKLPTRFRNNVLLGKEMNCLDLFPMSPENSKKVNSTKLISPSKEKDIKNKDKEVKFKDKETKMKEKEKEVKMKEKEKEAKVKRKDKEAKLRERDMELKVIEKPKRNESTKEGKGNEVDGEDINFKTNEKHVEETGIEKYSKLHRHKMPVKTIVKKDPKTKAIVSANLKYILNQSDLKKMAKLCHEETNHLLTLADVFVWCSIHFRYSCPCSAQVFILKNNRLVWKPTANRTHLTSKHMAQIVINNTMPKQHVYDRKCYSARTFGSVFNYKLRNSNPVFKSKRLNEIVNNVLCSTNSFIKIEFPSIKSVESHKLEVETTNDIDVNKVIPQISNNGIINKQKLSTDVIPCITPEVNKRKRSCDEVEEKKNVDKMKAKTYIITNNKDEIVFQSTKKKYRIGPAHFDFMGSYRPIVSNFPPKNNSKPNPSEQEIKSSINSSEVNESKTLPKYGLLCLTQGFGYLPVKEFTQKKLQVQDPLSENVFHAFKNIESANKWLNRFFKNRIVFESLNVNLKWVIVKPGILKHSQQFDKSLLENPSKIVNKDGFLVDISTISTGHGLLQQNKVITSSSNIQQADEQKKSRSLDVSNEVALKKAKICTDAQNKKVYLNYGVITANSIAKPTGIQQRMSHDSSLSKFVVPSTNVNHSGFIRLSGNTDSSTNEGCFIPLVLPTNSSKELSQPQNTNGTRSRETEPNLCSNIVKSKNCNPLTTEPKTTKKENVIVNRLGKTIPFSIKTLPGESILKTKFRYK